MSPALIVAALGVVYGDIGTSPLYAFKESVGGDHGAGVGHASVLGVLSMIFWAVTLVVSIKYVLIVLRANNGGEGGILALLALVLRQLPAAGRLTGTAVALGLFGAAMFYGDSVITPAISVLSAVEGLEVVSPHFKGFVIPLTLAVLIVLFAVQRSGTARVGSVFGPIMVLWFGTLGVLGALQIARDPGVLAAIDPVYAVGFFVAHPALTLTVMASVFLAVTGGEALYADMGHFGRRPIQIAWFWLVMPCLLLNYFGQGSLVLQSPDAVRNPFFLLAPQWLQLPLVLLATAATVIASQAVISGAFSITSQAIKLGYLPRMSVLFTSETAAGQIYVPFVNWMLLALVILLVIGFGSSSNLAAAYGIAVVSTMVITTLGVMVVARSRWDWSPLKLALILAPLLLLDVVFLVANSAKITHGGWFPLAFGGSAVLPVQHVEARSRADQGGKGARRPDTRAFHEEPRCLPAATGRRHCSLHVRRCGRGAPRAAAQPEAQPCPARARHLPDGGAAGHTPRGARGGCRDPRSRRRLLLRQGVPRLQGFLRHCRHRAHACALLQLRNGPERDLLLPVA